ncbi:Transcription factor TFIIIC isoform 1, partial [Dorcoceras hygrometricum]
IGEYEETIGTCIIFNESEVAPITHEEMEGPSETNLVSSKRITDPDQAPAKQINPLASLHKVLKFRLFLDADDENGEYMDASTAS